MPFDPNYVNAFRGISLPAIDAARQKNALGNLDLQMEQQKVAGAMNPNATPEQLARSGNVDIANAVTSQQQMRQQNAARYAGMRLAGVRGVEDMKKLVADPNFGSAMETVGAPHPSQVDNFAGVTDEQIRTQAATLARALGIQMPPATEGYTLGEGQRRFDASGNLVASGPDKQSNVPAGYRLKADGSGLEPIPGGPADKPESTIDPQALDIASSVVAANPVRIRDYASFGAGGQKIRSEINNRIAERLKESGMTANDLIQLRARAAAQPANLVKLTQQNAQIQQAEQLARANGQRVLDLIDLVDQTGVPLVEGITRSARAKAGNVDAAELKSVLNSFQIETARLLSGNPTLAGVISDSARQDIQHIAPDSMSAAQAKRIINRLFTEMDIRQAAAQEQMGAATNQTTVLPPLGGAAPLGPGTPQRPTNLPTNPNQRFTIEPL